MNIPTPNPVIAIAGIPGSGKTALMTALVTALAARLQKTALLFLDGFETPAMRLSAAELAQWLKAGARFDQFDIPGLAEALAALRAGRPALEPLSGRCVDPAPLILFEMPLGRTHPPTAVMVDLLVWLDVPLDVALARNVLAWESETPRRPRDWLVRHMHEYLALTRTVLAAQAGTVAPAADLRLDGTKPVADLAAGLINLLKQKGFIA